MRTNTTGSEEIYQKPAFTAQAHELAEYIQSLTVDELSASMKLSPELATTVHKLWQDWSDMPSYQQPAINQFIGDIYSGLRADLFTEPDRTYANDQLLILSGLYGVLRALDSIASYRLEMGYRLPNPQYRNLYSFWADRLGVLVPSDTTLVNLSSVEYTKALLPHISNFVITPRFLTFNSRTGIYSFVAVHAKIARGAFAHWLIRQRIESIDKLNQFKQLGYHYSAEKSTFTEPVFITDRFEGLGLSVRLK